jgi:hypothetical protein
LRNPDLRKENLDRWIQRGYVSMGREIQKEVEVEVLKQSKPKSRRAESRRSARGHLSPDRELGESYTGVSV